MIGDDLSQNRSCAKIENPSQMAFTMQCIAMVADDIKWSRAYLALLPHLPSRGSITPARSQHQEQIWNRMLETCRHICCLRFVAFSPRSWYSKPCLTLTAHPLELQGRGDKNSSAGNIIFWKVSKQILKPKITDKDKGWLSKFSHKKKHFFRTWS